MAAGRTAAFHVSVSVAVLKVAVSRELLLQKNAVGGQWPPGNQVLLKHKEIERSLSCKCETSGLLVCNGTQVQEAEGREEIGYQGSSRWEK